MVARASACVACGLYGGEGRRHSSTAAAAAAAAVAAAAAAAERHIASE